MIWDFRFPEPGCSSPSCGKTRVDETCLQRPSYVDTTIYDAVLILQRAGTSLWIPRGQDAVDTTANVWGNGQIGGAFDLKTRRYYAGSGDHITITDCQASAGGSGNWVAQNNWSIPIVIYGVNFGG